MEQYIPKSALSAEIERLAEVGRNNASGFDEYRKEKAAWLQQADVCDRILSFINTLEVKEVDLDEEIRKEIDKYYDECEKKLYKMKDDDTDMSFLQLDSFAKHFFELGLKVQKGE